MVEKCTCDVGGICIRKAHKKIFVVCARFLERFVYHIVSKHGET